MPSQEFEALKSAIISFPESNNQSVLSNNQTQGRGIFIVPSKGVPNRPSDITGYIIRSSNEDGKLEWSLETKTTVQGNGSIWFSDSSGNPHR